MKGVPNEKSITKKLISAVIAVSLAMGCAAISFADAPTGLVFDLLQWMTPTKVLLYADNEKTDPLGPFEYQFGSKIYYTLESLEGYYVDSYHIYLDLEYLDSECFILADSEYNRAALEYDGLGFGHFKHVNSFLAGDFDANSTVNLVDAVRMIRYLAGLDFVSEANKTSALRCGDYYRDDVFDLKDVTKLIRVLAGLDPSPFPGGVQTDFDVRYSTHVDRGEISQPIYSAPYGKYSDTVTRISSVDEYNDFISSLNFEIPLPVLDGVNEEEKAALEEEIAEKMRRTQISYRHTDYYNEDFFEKNELLVATSTVTGETKYTRANWSYGDLRLVDGVYTSIWKCMPSGVSSRNEFDTHEFISVPKGTIPADAEFAIEFEYSPSLEA